MLPWLDPIECRIAQQYLAHRQPLEAAKQLLDSSNRKHKAVREMLVQIGPQLVEQAREAFDSGDMPAANELISCAAQCSELTPEGRALQQKIVRECDRQRNHEQWRMRRLRTADEWARQGRLQSALGLIGPLGDEDPDAAWRRRDWAEAANRIDRYIRDFESYLSQGQFDAAEAVLQKARQAAPDQPQVLCLEEALAEARPTEGLTMSRAGESLAERNSVTDAGGAILPQSPAVTRLLFSGLRSYEDVLIIRHPAVLVGTTTDAWVHLPLQAMLHRQHAIIVREKYRESGFGYRLVPLSDCAVAVNDAPISDNQTRALVDGDVIQFGNAFCRWTFRQPRVVIPQQETKSRDEKRPNSKLGNGCSNTDLRSSTAVLEQTRPASAHAVAPDGKQVRCIVLAGDELVIGRDREYSHMIECDLPVQNLQLSWRSNNLYARAEGGAMFVNNVGHADTTAQPVELPAEIALYVDSQHDVADALLGGGGEYEMKIYLRGYP